MDTGDKVKKENARSAIREKNSIEKQYVKDLDRRGDSRLNKEANGQLGELGSILMKGRKEMAKQRLFKCHIDKIAFQMKYQTSRIKEIQYEIKHLRGDGNDNDVALSELKIELKKSRNKKRKFMRNGV